MNRLIISPPAGNWGRWPGTTPVLGTFTPRRRGGTLYRLWRFVRTLRPTRAGWTCRLGLPNKGIEAVDMKETRGCVLSVHGFDGDGWWELLWLARRHDGPVELNVSCPNAGARPNLGEVLPAVASALAGNVRLIAKLPPARWDDWALPLYEAGVRAFHCCNSMPCPAGSLSGKALKPYSLWATEELRKRWGKEVTLVGGGGVTCRQDVRDYLSAGADHVSVSSLLLNPLRWGRVAELVEEASR